MDESFNPEHVPHQITSTNVRVTTDSNLLTRTSWTDAKTALTQIKKVMFLSVSLRPLNLNSILEFHVFDARPNVDGDENILSIWISKL